MTVELQMLALGVVLGLVHLVPKVSMYDRGYLAWATGPRDDPAPPLPRVLARVDRAYRNYMETIPFFAAAVLAAHVTDSHGWMAVWGAHLYFWARLAYLPLYAAGVRLVRTLAWNAATLGIVLILAAMI